MPKLLREETVAVFIDHQEGLLIRTPSDQRETLEMYLRFMVKGMIALGVPMILTSNLENGAGGKLLSLFEELAPNAYRDRISRAGMVDVFDDPAFVQRCDGLNRRNMLIAGYPTEASAGIAANSARDRGHHVYVAMDACGSPAALSSAVSMHRLTQIGAAATTTFAAISEMARDLSSPTGIEAMKVIFEQIVYETSNAKL